MPEESSRERIAVLVVTHNSSDVLADMVASLPAGLGDLDWELVIADNASTDGTPELVEATWPSARLVRVGANAGYGAGANVARAAASPHTAALVLNPDVRLEPGCVPALVARMREAGAGVTVPLLSDGSGELIASQRREPTLRRAWADALVGATRAGRVGTWGEVVTDPQRYRGGAVIDWAEGSTQLVDAACWDALGGWDESYFLYSEETDLHLRAGDAGYPVLFVPQARATHLEGGSATSERLWPLVVANRLRLYAGRHRAPATAAFWAALLLREASRAALGKAPSRQAVRVLVDPAHLRRRRGPEWLAALSADA